MLVLWRLSPFFLWVVCSPRSSGLGWAAVASTTQVIKVTPRLDTTDVAADFPVAQVTVSNKPFISLISWNPKSCRNIAEELPFHMSKGPRESAG